MASTALGSPVLGGRLPRAASFSPTDLGAALFGWWKADGTLWQDATRLTPATADADPVGAWDDASGNARHLSQGNAARKPVLKLASQNGRSVVRGDGTDDFLAVGSITLAQPLTWCVAMKWTGAFTTYHVMVYGTDATTPAIYAQSGAPASLEMYAGTESIVENADTAWHSHIVGFDGAASTYHLDGTALTPAANPGTADYATEQIALFANAAGGLPGAGDIGEAFLVSGALTAGQRTSIQSYLQGRWGTP